MPVTVGELYEAPWGRYRVCRIDPGAGAWEVVLADVSSPTSLVGSTLADLVAGAKYTHVAGYIVPTGAAPSAPPSAPAPAAAPPPDPAPARHRRGGGVARRTLGAVRPMAGMRGLLPGHEGGGRLVTVPDAEEHYWLPCVRYADDPYYPEAEVVDGLEIHPRRPPIAIPHAMHITSNLAPRIRCDGCQPERVVVDPGVYRFIRERAIDRAPDHPYAPGAALPPPAPSTRPEPGAKTTGQVPNAGREAWQGGETPTLSLPLAPAEPLERPPSDAARLEREIEAWAATIAADPEPPPAPPAPSSPPSTPRPVRRLAPRWAPDLGTMGTVPPMSSTSIEITVLNDAGVAIGGLKGWMARFGTDDHRIYSALGKTCWEAIAWAIDGWIRRLRGEPLNLAQPASLSPYPPLYPEEP